jgi:O-6-methylguanine DNA methyltransferase
MTHNIIPTTTVSPGTTYFTYDMITGPITIFCSPDAVLGLSFGTEPLFTATYNESPLSRQAAEQLSEYFTGNRQIFNLPLNPQGTPFQKKVWQALLTIPYGETRYYEQIAKQIECPKSARAVGMANNRNPIAIIIPCHRVIGKQGGLVGYAGGLALKSWLLSMEEKTMVSSQGGQ